MKRLFFLVGVAFCILAHAGCESGSYAPMTPAVVRAGARAHVDETVLREGRTLFVSRCIECHTLPIVHRYDAAAWPWLVDDMSARAGLKRSERDAVVAYILAVRAQGKL